MFLTLIPYNKQHIYTSDPGDVEKTIKVSDFEIYYNEMDKVANEINKTLLSETLDTRGLHSKERLAILSFSTIISQIL